MSSYFRPSRLEDWLVWGKEDLACWLQECRSGGLCAWFRCQALKMRMWGGQSACRMPEVLLS